jgi:hypothetical protein
MGEAEWADIGRLGAMSNAIRVYNDILSRRRPVGKISLALAAFEGRDYFAEIRERRDALIARRVALAESLRARGVRVKKLDAYRRAL